MNEAGGEEAAPRSADGEYSPDSVLRGQLFQYAEDMRQALSDHADLQRRYYLLEEAYASLGGNRGAIDRLAECSHDLYLITDDSGLVRYANRRALERFGGVSLFGAPLAELLASERPGDNEGESPRCFGNLEFCLTRCHSPCRLRVLPTAPVNGGSACAHWFIRDIPAWGKPALGLDSETIPTPDALLIFDADGKILAANPIFLKVAGYAPEDIAGQPLSLLNCEFQPCMTDADVWRQLRETGHWHGPMYTRIQGDDARRDWTVVNAAVDRDGNIGGCLAVFSDLLPLREMEKRFAYLAHHDMLTGLPNRLLFSERLNQALRQTRRTGTQLAVVFIDLDGFKPVNDTLGHAAGDCLLQRVARGLSSAMREADTVARLGGDEFAILIQGLKDARDAGTIGKKILDIFALLARSNEQAPAIGASIGIGVFPDHGETADILLHRADLAMYAAKNAGGNTYRVYQPALS